jgi:hypothetical protein
MMNPTQVRGAISCDSMPSLLFDSIPVGALLCQRRR